MKTKTRFVPFANFPIYPILFAIYPVIALYGSNITQVASDVIWRPLWGSLLLGSALWFLFYAVMRDIHRSALFSSAFIMVFYTYGHAFLYLRFLKPLESKTDWHFILLPATLLALGVVFWWIQKKIATPYSWTRSLNLLSVFLLIYPLVQTTSYLLSIERSQMVKQEKLQDASLRFPYGYAPDIYYFVLDGYGRNDVFQDSFGYDNSAFTDELKNRGFYVAECSQSNYAITLLSLGSSLNLDYMDTLGAFGKESANSIKPEVLVVHNEVRRVLQKMGYTIVSFENGYRPSHWENADYFLVAPEDHQTNDFEWLFIGTSAARVYFDIFSRPLEEHDREVSRIRTSFAIQQLKETIPSISGPKFVFAHLIIPHPPYVFGPAGQMVSADVDEKTAYVGQVQYINQQMNEILNGVLTDSSTPPIIIIQGDHGPDGRLLKDPTDRMKILNAYFLPGSPEILYPAVTPVNSFRILLNEYFGTSYELLEDVSLHSSYSKPFAFREVDNECLVESP